MAYQLNSHIPQQSVPWSCPVPVPCEVVCDEASCQVSDLHRSVTTAGGNKPTRRVDGDVSNRSTVRLQREGGGTQAGRQCQHDASSQCGCMGGGGGTGNVTFMDLSLLPVATSPPDASMDMSAAGARWGCREGGRQVERGRVGEGHAQVSEQRWE